MELNEALGQISEIRAQLARTQTFRGFRPLTVGFSGLLGIAAAAYQGTCLLQPTAQVLDFVDLWVGVAVLSLLVVGTELALSWPANFSLKRRLTILAIQQFFPCLIAGATVTAVIALRAPDHAWMLPGLWSVLFSLGVFACARLLPRPTYWVGVYYLVAGTVCLAIGPGEFALSPWLMAGTFGVGQLLAAAILYFTEEQAHDPLET
jgi:hypothetical protein